LRFSVKVIIFHHKNGKYFPGRRKAGIGVGTGRVGRMVTGSIKGLVGGLPIGFIIGSEEVGEFVGHSLGYNGGQGLGLTEEDGWVGPLNPGKLGILHLKAPKGVVP